MFQTIYFISIPQQKFRVIMKTFWIFTYRKQLYLFQITPQTKVINIICFGVTLSSFLHKIKAI